MQAALREDVSRDLTRAEARREQLAEIQRRLDKQSDYQRERLIFECEQAAIRGSRRLRWLRATSGENSFQFRYELDRRVKALLEASNASES
jgi:hypothetical protein